MRTFLKTQLIPSLCILICGQIVATIQSDDEFFMIKNPHSGLVLDAPEKFVTLQSVTGNHTQHWRLELARGGAYYIVNRATEKVIDVDYGYPLKNTWVIVSEKLGGYNINCKINNGIPATTMNMDACQKWHIHYNGVFVNVCSYYAIDIKDNKYNKGVYLETWTVNGNDNQKFKLEYV